MARRPSGPKLLTPATEAAVCKAVAAGVPLRFAGPAAGICRRTLFYWLAAGRRGAGPVYAAFLAAVETARARAVASRLVRIEQAGAGGAVVERLTRTRTTAAGDTTTTVVEKFTRPAWAADAWVLERTHPGDFGPDRRELRELRKAVADLTARYARLAPPDASNPPPPPVGPA